LCHNCGKYCPGTTCLTGNSGVIVFVCNQARVHKGKKDPNEKYQLGCLFATANRPKLGVDKLSEKSTEAREQHWAKTRSLTIMVLIIWFIFSMVIPWNAKALNAMSFMGFELGYYMCVQGSLAVFVLLIFFQNWRQDAIDDEFGVDE